MSSELIFQRLLELAQSGKFNDYYPEHVANMDCFYYLDRFLEKNGKQEEYNQLFLSSFREELTKVLEECQGKIRPVLSPHVEFHITPRTEDLIFALISLEGSWTKFTLAVNYLKDKSPLEYHDLPAEFPIPEKGISIRLDKNEDGHVSVKDGKKILHHCRNPDGVVGRYYFDRKDKKISTITSVKVLDKDGVEFTVDPEIEEEDAELAGSVFTADYVKLFNALEVFDKEDQVTILCKIVERQLKDYYLSNFAEMTLKPNHLYYGEIVLMAKTALSLYGEQELQKCVEFFRQNDEETESDFRMGL